MPVQLQMSEDGSQQSEPGRTVLRPLSSAFWPLVFYAMRNPGAGQDFTGLAAAVQLRLRIAFGPQTLTVKSRFLPGENTVRIRGGPPFAEVDS